MLQQPLALGYLVSTAPLGAMPRWWWAGCAHLRDACPAFLKNALHLQCGQANDDYPPLTQRRDAHPLDSTTTTDVLRSVHNSVLFSWGKSGLRIKITRGLLSHPLLWAILHSPSQNRRDAIK